MHQTDYDWGTEKILANNDLYTAAHLHILEGMKLPLMFHMQHDKTWIILRGQVELRVSNLRDGTTSSRLLGVGDSARIWPLMPAQLVAVSDCEVLQVGNGLDFRDRLMLPATAIGATPEPLNDPSLGQVPVSPLLSRDPDQA